MVSQASAPGRCPATRPLRSIQGNWQRHSSRSARAGCCLAPRTPIRCVRVGAAELPRRWLDVRGARRPAPRARRAARGRHPQRRGAADARRRRRGPRVANTCRHRGHKLLPCGSSATAKAIVSPPNQLAARRWPRHSPALAPFRAPGRSRMRSSNSTAFTDLPRRRTMGVSSCNRGTHTWYLLVVAEG